MRLETDRLILRRWRPEDLDPYAAMMADPRVGDWLGGACSREVASQSVATIEAHFEQRGFGPFVIERRVDGVFLGVAGLSAVREVLASTPVAGLVEAGWRLATYAWGAGYASEAARAAMEDGFSRLGLAEIVAFTASTNTRSQAVMMRLGMTRRAELDFDHLGLDPSHPLRAHVVFSAAPGRA